MATRASCTKFDQFFSIKKIKFGPVLKKKCFESGILTLMFSPGDRGLGLGGSPTTSAMVTRASCTKFDQRFFKKHDV